MSAFMFYLVMLIPNTERPTSVLMMPFHTATECNAMLARAPKEYKDKWACIEINMSPENEGKKA